MSENAIVPPPRLHHNVLPPPGIHPTAAREYRPPLSIIKFLELSLAITCTTLHYYSFDDGDLVTGFLATGTFCGFIVILFTIMAGTGTPVHDKIQFGSVNSAVCVYVCFPGYLMKAHLHRRLSIFYSLLGCACFLTSGVFIIEAWEHAFRTRTRDLAITKGSIAVINGVIFLMDTIFTFRDRK
uniref:Uncharacterized protein n=1 Tax=Anopheles stephensi TaxID=30069 RepID=A0A182Y548_ANOST